MGTGVPTPTYRPASDPSVQPAGRRPTSIARKAVPYPEYKTGKCPETHCRKFEAAIRLNGETENMVQLELFGNSLTEKESNWFTYHRRIHPTNTMQEVFTAFKKRYRTIKTDDQTYIQFRTINQQPKESVDDYAERLQQLADNLTVPPDDMFMLSNFRAGLLEYLQVATVGLQRDTFSEAVDSARTAEEGLPQPRTPPTSTGDNHRHNLKCTGCGRMGHEWGTCYRNPTSEYGKKTDTASIHQIQPQPAPSPVSTENRHTSRSITPVQRYPCNICGSLEHPGHRCPLLLDEDVKKAIQSKLPTQSGSSVVITDVHTIDVPHMGPRTRSQTQPPDSVITNSPTEAPRPTKALDWRNEEQLREEMIRTVRELQDLSPLESPSPRDHSNRSDQHHGYIRNYPSTNSITNHPGQSTKPYDYST